MSETAPAGAVKAGQSYVEFFAVDGKFNKDMTAMGNRLKAFGSFATKAGAALAAAGTSVAGGLLAAAHAAAEAGSQINDMAARTGASVKLLSGMRYAANMAGSSIEGFETALKGMAKNLYGADEESKQALKTLGNLGLSIDTLKGKKPDEQFLMIADALSKVDDPTRRSALAMKIFGKSGAELLPVLAGGRAGILDMLREAEKLGYVLSDEDAAAADELGDSIDAVKMAIGGAVTQIGLAVAGPLTDWANWTKDQIPLTTKWIKEHQGAIVLVGKLAAGLAIAGTALSGFGIAAASVGMGMTQASAGMSFVLKNGQAMKGLGLAAVAIGIAAAVMHWCGAQEELNRQLKITNELNDKLAKKGMGRTQQEIDATKGMSLGDRRRALEEQKAQKQKALSDNNKWVVEGQGRLDKASSGWNWGNNILDVTTGSGTLDSIRGDIKDAEARSDAVRSEIEEIDAAIKAVESQQQAEEEGREKRAGEKRAARRVAIGKSALNWGNGVLTKGVGLFESGKELANQVIDDNADDDKKLADDAKAMKEEQKTPEQKFKDRIARAERMRDAGHLTEQQLSMEKAKIQLESTQGQADKLAKRTEGRESLGLDVGEEQKKFLAAQAGKRDLEAEALKAARDGVLTQEQILAEQKRLNQYLAANGVKLVEVGT